MIPETVSEKCNRQKRKKSIKHFWECGWEVVGAALIQHTRVVEGGGLKSYHMFTQMRSCDCTERETSTQPIKASICIEPSR